VQARSNVAYASGYLLYYLQGKLLAQPFDPDKLEVTGDAVTVAENVRYEKGFFRAIFDASRTGALVYQHGANEAKSDLVWFDRTGKRLGNLGESDEYYDVRIAPDGEHVAASVGDPGDIWIFDVKRGVRARLTFEQFNEQSPIYSPDGTQMLFSSDRSAMYDAFKRTLTGRSVETPLLTEPRVNEYGTDWTRDYIVFNREDPQSKTQSDICALPVNGGKPFPVIETAAFDTDGRVSPDGRWLAYTSLESGRAEVYVTSFPQPTAKWQVSSSGGGTPLWRGDGRELYYIDTARRTIVAVPIASGATIEAGAPTELFEVAIKVMPPPFYDVSRDGTRFLVNTLPDAADAPITLVTNWTAELQK
jgi:hypothetical protein